MRPYVLCAKRWGRLARLVRVDDVQVQESAGRGRRKVTKVVVDREDGKRRWSVRAAVLLVLLGSGSGFEVVEDGAEAEPLRGESEPTAFPDPLVPSNPARCPARPGIPRDVWDREVG